MAHALSTGSVLTLVSSASLSLIISVFWIKTAQVEILARLFWQSCQIDGKWSATQSQLLVYQYFSGLVFIIPCNQYFQRPKKL